MTLDGEQIFDALGGGASAVMVLGLAIAVVMLWRKYIAVQDARVEDQKAHAQQLLEAIRALDRTTDLVEKRNG